MSAHLITVTPRQEQSGIVWELCYTQHKKQPKCGGPGNYPDIMLPRPDKGAQVFMVSINDPNELDIRFSDDPLWIQPGKDLAPPQKQAGINTDQIEGVIKFPNNNTSIVFNDRNTNTEWLNYQLNFVDKTGKKVTPIDPDIKNGGGEAPPPPPPPPPLSPAEEAKSEKDSAYFGHVAGFDAAAIVVGLIIGLIIGLILCWMRSTKSAVAG